MPAIMMSAEVGFIPNVTGISNAMLADGPMPGSTPTMVPRKTPRNVYQRLIGCRQTAKPLMMCCRVSTARSSERQDTARETHAQHLEHEIAADAETHAREHVGDPFAGIEVRGKPEQKKRRRDHESQRLEDEEVQERPGDHAGDDEVGGRSVRRLPFS